MMLFTAVVVVVVVKVKTVFKKDKFIAVVLMWMVLYEWKTHICFL